MLQIPEVVWPNTWKSLRPLTLIDKIKGQPNLERSIPEYNFSSRRSWLRA